MNAAANPRASPDLLPAPAKATFPCEPRLAGPLLAGLQLKHLEEFVHALTRGAARGRSRGAKRGGHDATAFAVHAACEMLSTERGAFVPCLVEMAGYHNSQGRIVTGEFLPCSGDDIVEAILSPSECCFKRRLFECFKTQQGVLHYFAVQCERFRPAPKYRFDAPPHPGRLWHELFDWGMTAQRSKR